MERRCKGLEAKITEMSNQHDQDLLEISRLQKELEFVQGEKMDIARQKQEGEKRADAILNERQEVEAQGGRTEAMLITENQQLTKVSPLLGIYVDGSR